MLKFIQKCTFLLLVVGLLSGCSVFRNNLIQQEELMYLQDQEASFERYKLEAYRIQPRDLLAVNLTSPDPKMTTYFNRDNSSGLRLNQSDPASLYRAGYTVSDTGGISLPLIGVLKVEGKTVEEIEADIAEKMRVYLKEFSVSVKVTNFRITLLGEVKSPGTYYFYENKITLFQAISQAGGFSDYANRNKVRIVREQGNKVETFILDLESVKVVENKGFILTQADAIYVEPLRAKVFGMNSGVLSLILSAITASVTIYGIVTR